MKKCDLVICLCIKQPARQPQLVSRSEHKDIVIGYDSGKLIANAQIFHNKTKRKVIVAQTASKGLMAGKTIINFDKYMQKCGVVSKISIPGNDDKYQFALFRLKSDRNQAKIT